MRQEQEEATIDQIKRAHRYVVVSVKDDEVEVSGYADDIGEIQEMLQDGTRYIQSHVDKLSREN
jgi:hypothetical protein